MPVRQATPKEVIEMLTLREAGYSVLHISQQLGFSHRTVSRYIADNQVKKGKLKADVIQAARDELAKVITSDPTIRDEAARLIVDDLAQTRHIRDIMIEASEHLIATDLKGAVLVMRAAAAYSTAIKNTSDILRNQLGLDKAKDELEDLPELTIKVITDSQAVEMHQASIVKEGDEHGEELDLMEED